MCVCCIYRISLTLISPSPLSLYGAALAIQRRIYARKIYKMAKIARTYIRINRFFMHTWKIKIQKYYAWSEPFTIVLYTYTHQAPKHRRESTFRHNNNNRKKSWENCLAYAQCMFVYTQRALRRYISSAAVVIVAIYCFITSILFWFQLFFRGLVNGIWLNVKKVFALSLSRRTRCCRCCCCRCCCWFFFLLRYLFLFSVHFYLLPIEFPPMQNDQYFKLFGKWFQRSEWTEIGFSLYMCVCCVHTRKKNK